MAIYRLILETAATGSERFATGATYPGCQRIANPAACDPKGFDELQQAVDYAISKSEVPVRVTSVEQVDNILAGMEQITSDMIIPSSGGGGIFANISTPVLLGVGALALVMFSKKRR